jgi:hypothetical protein
MVESATTVSADHQKRVYTKGASAEPSLRIIRADKKSSIMMIGASQYFFLCRKNSQNSANIPSLLIMLTWLYPIAAARHLLR